MRTRISTKSIAEALGLLRRGNAAAARDFLQQLVRTDARNVDAWYLLACAQHQLGAHEAAALAYQTVIDLDANHADGYYYLGNVRGQNYDHEAAIACYRRALELKPAFAAAARNLGATLHLLGRTHEAIACYRRYLEHGPPSADIYLNLGNALADLGQHADAIESYRKALKLGPARSELHLYIGNLLDELGQLDAALVEYEAAAALDPGSIAARRALGAALMEQGRAEDALACYRRCSPSGDSGLRIRAASVLPAIPQSKEDLLWWRNRFEKEISHLGDAALSLTDPPHEVGCTNFFLSYHGLNNRELNIKVAKLYETACPALTWTAPHCLKRTRQPGRIRVGFISRHLRSHSIGKTTRGLLAKLSRDEFEAIALFVPPLSDDEVAKFIREASDRALVVPATLEAARQAIADLELDVLFYQDIGMEPFTYFLAFSRLAPVQCTSFGHPDTTGIANIDFFISNDLFEPAQAQAHYSERLFLLHGLGTLAYYYRPVVQASKRREDFNLPARANLYLCPQTLFKFHPDFDAIVAAILRGDPQGRLVMIEGETRTWRELLQRRLHAAFPDVTEQIISLPRQSGTEFTQLIAACDVMLDTVHFNGMNTSLEAFATGTPVVTLPTDLQRGRHTAGMYRKMGLMQCVAQDAEDYVRIALSIATDRERRRQISNEILQRNYVLFEDMRAVREFERFFRESCSRT